MTQQEKKEIIEKACEFSTMALILTSCAKMFIDDYENMIYKLNIEAQRETKQMLNRNIELAKSLNRNLTKLDRDMINIINQGHKGNEDHYINDVGFAYNVLKSTFDVCGDSEKRRNSILKKIKTAYKTEPK